MKRSQALAVLVLSLMVATVIPVQQVYGQGPYSEKLNVFIAGNNALWYFTYSGVNGSAGLRGLENSPGLSWYNLTAVKTSGWSSDFQIFGPHGYNLFPVASPPAEGALLSVGSDSYSDASAAAAAAGAYMLTQFVSSANASGTYSFYAPLTFNTIVPRTLLALIPSGAGGFASAISTSGFEATQSPLVILEGTKVSSAFQHNLVVGSISGLALDGSSRPSILTFYGTTVSSLQASAHSSSSTIQVRVLDGVMKSKDHAVVVNDTANFDSSYTLTLSGSQKVTGLNATVLQQPPTLVAYRVVSRGVLHFGQKLGVTVTLENLSPNQPLTGINFTDNWWVAGGNFKLDSAKNSSTFPSSIGAAGTVTPVYVLKYIGNGTGRVTVPASVITYNFSLGGSKFEARTVLNPINLSLGIDDAVVYSYASPTGGFAKSVGAQQSVRVTAVNAGSQAASSVTVAGQSISGLGVNASTTVAVTQSASGLTQRNGTQSYETTYQDIAGNQLTSVTNVVFNLFSHTSMKLGLPMLVVRLASWGVNLTITFTVSNRGTANVTSFTSHIILPPGLPCGVIKGNGTSCSSGVVSINYSNIAALKSFTSSIIFNATAPQNFILHSSMFSGTASDMLIQGVTNPLGIPNGVAVTKRFAPSQLFGGMTSAVSLVAVNAGPFTVYNVTFSSSADSFDVLSSTGTPTMTAPNVIAGGNSTLTYNVKAISTEGTLNSTPSTAVFYFGGNLFTQTYSGPQVTVYRPLAASVTTSPTSLEEGKAFTLYITITNPSGVAVSNIQFTVAVPSGLTITSLQGMTLLGKNISITAANLGSHSSLNTSATVESSQGMSVPFSKAELLFTYGGVTVSGSVPSGGIAIRENVTVRYLLPISLALVVLLGAVYYVRRISKPSVPASRP